MQNKFTKLIYYVNNYLRELFKHSEKSGHLFCLVIFYLQAGRGFLQF